MSKWSRLLIGGLIAMALAIRVKAPLEPPFFFLQMADPQFGMYTGDRSFDQETANFEFAVATANRLRPAFVIVCGDLINKTGDPAQAAEYFRIAAKLDPAIRLYNVPGNHDVGNRPTPQTLAAYRETFGPDYYSFRSNGLVGIVLNSSLISDPSGAPKEAAEQEAWLRAELEKLRQEGAAPRLVFQHHPFFLQNPEEADGYYNIPRVRRQIYLDLLEKYGVSHVFAGHYHRNARGRSGDLEMVTTGPVGKPLGRDPSGLRVVIVRSTGLEHRYYDFGFLPNQIDLGK